MLKTCFIKCSTLLKVAKEDISVRFFEEIDDNIVWEGYGDFQHTNVHKQVAISFRTPRYKSIDVDQQVRVNIVAGNINSSVKTSFFILAVLHSTETTF